MSAETDLIWHCESCGAATPYTEEDKKNGYEIDAVEPCLMCDDLARVRKGNIVLL
jgi:hypothetical protein